MKRCAYCTAENRDEAIFCRRCRRPLQDASAPRGRVSGTAFRWLGVGVVIALLGFYLFSSRSLLAPFSVRLSTGTHTLGPVPTWTREPVTRRTCVNDRTHIRRGPSTQYETTGGLISGMCLTILGRNEDGSWVYMVSDDHLTGWVAVAALPDVGDLSQVSIRDQAGTATSTRPTLTSAEIAHGAQAYLTQVAATNLPGAPLSRYVVPCFESVRRTGEHVSCRMERAYCDYLPALEGRPTVCSDRPAPDQTFAFVVFGEDWSEFDGQCLLVSGYLQINGGVLQIEVLDGDQVSPCS